MKMGEKKKDLPKVYPFVQQEPAHKPRPSAVLPVSRSNSKVSERGLLSVLTLLISLGALTTALLGGGKLILDIFNDGLFNNLDKIGAKAIVLGLAYVFGWFMAAVSVRVYNNLILPIIINIYTWACLIAVDLLYLKIIQKLYDQKYDIPHYFAYLLIIAAGLAALVGLHLILEGHDLRPYAIPLLLICLIQLAFIVFRYVFTTDAKSLYLLGDLVFFGAMTFFSVLMIAHMGILTPFRRRLTSFFDRNSLVIRPER
ncbi:MAG: hypothetical protein HYX49_03450 [Chloroflexi bacterium]|nr:hypothetical protein [Chloroflexota bacterium]